MSASLFHTSRNPVSLDHENFPSDCDLEAPPKAAIRSESRLDMSTGTLYSRNCLNYCQFFIGVVIPSHAADLEAVLTAVLGRSWDPRAISARSNRGWDGQAAEFVKAFERLLSRTRLEANAL